MHEGVRGRKRDQAGEWPCLEASPAPGPHCPSGTSPKWKTQPLSRARAMLIPQNKYLGGKTHHQGTGVLVSWGSSCGEC